MPSEPAVLVATSEFTLKSSPVRRTLEQRLIDDLKTALRTAGFEGYTVEKHAARIVVHQIENPGLAAQTCAAVFGVAYAAPVSIVPASMDGVLGEVTKLAEARLGHGQSFAIRSHRATPSSLSRREIEVRGGAEVLRLLGDRGIVVNLENPDVTIFVDLADDRAYVYSDKISGPSGLPISSQWKMLAVLDSGPLSALAAYSMMRRGCLVQLLVPLSGKVSLFAADYQLGLAHRIRSLIPRQTYRAYTLALDKITEATPAFDYTSYMALRAFTRAQAMNLARKKRFKAIILSDVSGSLKDLVTSPDLPIIYPLIGVNEEDLEQLGKPMGFELKEILDPTYESQAEFRAESLTWSGSLSEDAIEQINL